MGARMDGRLIESLVGIECNNPLNSVPISMLPNIVLNHQSTEAIEERFASLKTKYTDSGPIENDRFAMF